MVIVVAMHFAHLFPLKIGILIVLWYIFAYLIAMLPIIDVFILIYHTPRFYYINSHSGVSYRIELVN